MRHQTRWLTLGIASLACALLAGASLAGPAPAGDLAASPRLDPGLASASTVHRPKPYRLKSTMGQPAWNPDVLAAPPNDQCSGAITIPCGNISLSGNTFGARNDYDFADTTLSCTTYSAGGRDIVYKLSAVAGDSIWLNYDSSADASIYIVTDCAHVQDSCKVGADENHQGQVETLRYGFKRTTTYYLILDSYGKDTDGTWTLVGQFFSCGLHPPANDRCETATSLYCGGFLYTGDTNTAQNDYSFPSVGASCVGSLAQGRDVVFALNVTAGDSLSASYTSSANGLLYVIAGCTPAGSPVNCIVGANATGVGGAETLNYRFAFTGSYFLVLDSDGLNTSGTWSLSGSLTCGLNAPTNDQCSTATYLPCGSFSLSGDNSLALPDYDPTDLAPTCTGFSAVGSDVVYRIDSSPGDSLWCDYVFPHVNGKDDVDASIYLVTDCSNVPGTCVAGADVAVSAQMEHLRYKFTNQATYYLILDCYDPGIYGVWTAMGAVICPQTTGVGDRPGVTQASLGSPFPNPFEISSTLRFALPTRSRGSLRILDLSGRVVRTLLEGELRAGSQSVTWDARDDRGARVPVGTYFARLMVGDVIAHRTIILVR